MKAQTEEEYRDEMNSNPDPDLIPDEHGGESHKINRRQFSDLIRDHVLLYLKSRKKYG